ncbi:MAG: carbamate kinase [Dehalococcoidales bacterium]|jgi:carbamate kinase|nr:carbamate kinase [Dehalococcoidales bacterium]MDP6449044.1 carbamate kinase [Dehalococcoidales bacterium]MDP6577194.1 carbamate kinase [Dehalococcoidales bacterium]
MSNKNKNKIFVIALGGNSIIRAKEKGTAVEQYQNLDRTAEQLLNLLSSGNRVIITHGNGPQIGNLLLADEAAKNVVPPMPLDVLGAQTEGYMGYMIQNTLANHLRQAGASHNITTVVTQVIVDKNDPAFKDPSKPIGPFYDANEAEQLRQEKGWDIIEDSARGYRRVVPSPIPVNIQQARIIKSMLNTGEIVIAVGGGGVPMVREDNHNLRGVEAVIDKDYASVRLAIEIDADVLFILTAVEHVYRDFATPHQKALENLSLAEAKKLLEEGHFGKGNMEPKIRAAIMFLEETKPSREREVIITIPETALRALEGKTGTRITR